jgi:hypothetical protein
MYVRRSEASIQTVSSTYKDLNLQNLVFSAVMISVKVVS